MLYKEAARILQRIKKKEGSVKSLVLGSKYKNIKQLYALVCETLKYRKIILEVLKTSQFFTQEHKILKTEELALVLVYDFLFGKGVLSGTQKSIKDAVDKHKSVLNSTLAKIKIKLQVSKNEDLLETGEVGGSTVRLPRYVRVNLIKTTVDAVCRHFEEQDGYSRVDASGLSYDSYIDLVKNLETNAFVLDPHLFDVLVFHPRCDLHDHRLYINGDIILQDKASCLPAHCLRPPPGAHVFDTCAAPGNKTSHVASLMGNKGKVFSFDLDPKRASIMKKLLTSAKVACAEVKVMDFLKVKDHDVAYKDVQCAVVDPSCSGSGIVSRLDHLTNDDDSQDTERLEKLAAFQSSILLHTLSFPNVKKVVYSTCSVHEVENEKVVQKVLQQCGNRFKLQEIFPSIPSRGHSIFPGAENTLRLSPEKDATNGFFVACFVRTNQDVESNLKKKAKKRKHSEKSSSYEALEVSQVSKVNSTHHEHCKSTENSTNNGFSGKSKPKNKKKRRGKRQPVTNP